jgi:hypothetical protein
MYYLLLCAKSNIGSHSDLRYVRVRFFLSSTPGQFNAEDIGHRHA